AHVVLANVGHRGIRADAAGERRTAETQQDKCRFHVGSPNRCVNLTSAPLQPPDIDGARPGLEARDAGLPVGSPPETIASSDRPCPPRDRTPLGCVGARHRMMPYPWSVPRSTAANRRRSRWPLSASASIPRDPMPSLTRYQVEFCDSVVQLGQEDVDL